MRVPTSVEQQLIGSKSFAVLVAVLLLCMPVVTTGDERDALAKTEIDRLERAWTEAYLRGDTARLGALLADDVLFVLPDSPPTGKTEAVSTLRSDGVRFIRYDTREIDIHEFGDTVVVYGHAQRTRVVAENRVQDNWRFTKVYVRRDGRWRVVAFHASERP